MALVSALFLCIVASNAPTAPEAQAVPGIKPEQARALQLGAWRMLGPIAPRASVGIKSPAQQARLQSVGIPWQELSASHVGPENILLPWLEPDVDGFLSRQDEAQKNPRQRLLLDSGELHLEKLLPLISANPDFARRAVVYLYLPVIATTATTLSVQCGAAGKFSLWWNGKRLLKDRTPQHFDSANYALHLKVSPGLNHLLVELRPGSMGWIFEMQSLRRIANSRIHRAIDRGVQYLLSHQAIDGSWPAYANYPNGVSALALYTLIKSGISPQQESVLKGLAHLRLQRAERTYSVALELMAYHVGGNPTDHERIEELAADLVDWQMPNGMWGYGADTSNWSGDLSNTQYAALGLRAAAAEEVSIPQRTWIKLAQGVLACSDHSTSNRGTSNRAITGSNVSSAGFHYLIGSGHGVNPSMTAAGIGTLAICRKHLGPRTSQSLLHKLDQAIAAGSLWLGQNWTLGNGSRSVWNFYYLYGLERAGGLADTETFSTHEWYWEGARHIVNLQQDNGSWGALDPPLVDCFALLFLRRATTRAAITTNVAVEKQQLLAATGKSSGLKMRLSLQAPASLWIDRTSPGFDEIVRVIYWLKPPLGDWQRIEEFQQRRFAIRPSLNIPGNWSIRADAVQADGHMLSSGVVEFQQLEGTTPERLAYVFEGEKNLVPTGHPTIDASSEQASHLAAAVADGNPNTYWACAPEDSHPTLDLHFRRAHKAKKLKLVLAPTGSASPDPAPRITQVEIQINNNPAKTLTVSTDLQQKTVLEFEKTQTVKRIRLRVLSASSGRLGENISLGLAEIEVYQ